MAKARILVVEDDRIVAKDIQESLEVQGYTVFKTVPSGEAAIEVAKEDKPDLILMDIKLKGEMNGTEAAEQIKQEFNIPIIYLTAYSDDDVLGKAKITEPFGYLIKPFDDRELNTTIEIALYKHKMERKLKESEKWVSTTLRSIGDAVIATDINGNVAYLNPTAEALTQWNQKDAIGKPLKEIFNIINEKTKERVESPVDKIFKEDRIVGLANGTILIAKDGKEIPIDDSGSPIKNEKGKLIGVVLVFRDTTEHKQAQEALKETEKLNRMLMDSLPHPAMIIKQKGRVVLASNKLAKSIGIDKGSYCWEDFGLCKFISKKNKKLLSEGKDLEDPQCSFCLADQCVDNENVQNDPNVIGADGNTYDTHWIHIEDDLYLHYGIDVTERKGAEDEIMKTKQLLEQTSRMAVVGGWEKDFIAQSDVWSDITREIHEVDADFIPDMENSIAFYKEGESRDRITEVVTKTIETGEPFDEELQIVTAKGNERWIRAMGNGRFKENKCVGLFGTFQEITQRKQAKEAIKNLLHEKELLLKEVHHRIRNNMSTIKALLILQSDALVNNPEAVNALKEAENRVQSMLVLYDKLFLTSDYENVSTKKYFETLIDEVIQNFSLKQMVNVAYDIEDAMLDVKTVFNLGIIVNELITNSIKHAFIVKESGKINVSLSVDQGHVVFTIQDDGTELPESISFENPSNGFGFKLVSMLVKQLDGNIQIEQGNGTKFTIKFNIETQS